MTDLLEERFEEEGIEEISEILGEIYYDVDVYNKTKAKLESKLGRSLTDSEDERVIKYLTSKYQQEKLEERAIPKKVEVEDTSENSEWGIKQKEFQDDFLRRQMAGEFDHLHKGELVEVLNVGRGGLPSVKNRITEARAPQIAKAKMHEELKEKMIPYEIKAMFNLCLVSYYYFLQIVGDFAPEGYIPPMDDMFYEFYLDYLNEKGEEVQHIKTFGDEAIKYIMERHLDCLNG